MATFRVDSLQAKDRYGLPFGIAALWQYVGGSWLLLRVETVEHARLVQLQVANPDVVATVSTLAHDAATAHVPADGSVVAPLPLVLDPAERNTGSYAYELPDKLLRAMGSGLATAGQPLDMYDVAFQCMLGTWDFMLAEVAQQYVEALQQ